jgi:hypothetical protein
MNAAARKSLPQADRAKALTRRWDWRKWGTLDDPCHKSQLSTLIGEFSCTEQFKRDRQREVTGEQRETCSGKTEMGTAAHDTIARALRHPLIRDGIVSGTSIPTEQRVRSIVVEEFARATAGREVVWYGKAEHDKTLRNTVAMVLGLFQDLHNHVAEVVLVEGGFIVQLGELFAEGHTDLIYKPRENPDALAFTDWKTGATKPHQLELDHGYEGGLYSLALERGLFLPREVLDGWRRLIEQPDAENSNAVPLDPDDLKALELARDDREAMHAGLRGVMRRYLRDGELPPGVRFFGVFPEVIRLTALADYVPYEKKGDKAISREEDAEYWTRVHSRVPAYAVGEKVKYEAGQWRGGAWLRVRRNAGDVQRLEHMLRAVVGWVRFGKFAAAVGEKCTRCSYRAPCLTDGYELRGEAAKQLSDSLKGLDLSAVGDLSVDD